MAMLLMDGFEESVLNTYRWPTTVGTAAVGSSYGRLGGSGVRLGDNTATSIQRSFTLTDDTFIYAFGLKVVDDNAGAVFVTNPFGGSSQIQNGGIVSRIGITNINGVAGSYYTDAGVIIALQWHHVIFKVKFGDTGGIVEIWVDGVQEVNVTSLDLDPRPTSLTPRFGGIASTDMDEFYMDDLLILDGSGSSNNDIPDDARVYTLYPNGDCNYSGLTGSDGNQVSNYLQVDDDPIVLTAYNGSSTDGDKDTYDMEDTTGSGDVLAVQLEAIANKDDAGTKFGKTVLRSGTTDDIGASTGLAVDPSWTSMMTMYDTDPDTATAWTTSGVDSAEAGFQVSDT